MRALFPGRFQPFHLGHLQVVKWLLDRYEELIIMIGSGQESHSPYNPFTAGERLVMVKESLAETGIDLRKVVIFPVMESFTSKNWIRIVEMYSPHFDVIISGNPLVYTVAKEAGYMVERVPMFNRDIYNATRIRKLIMENDLKWMECVPKSVSQFIRDIKGDERIRDVTKNDYTED
ncbi:nicotinamide-nucleotide adenylyltransferase [Sulfolobus acidocaldarius]|uniref:Nicotinamide-nucleotide adenylyltransferase 1 n=4 Tax=Sulfolobus acidocaldarius TaxID=2285 RepID=NADM1_SULAC|nr:nicotinamide-nucleotide adenylyltransferase [Sulfolobus acidocaldarius]Q4JBW3.1 RecName: Full=Nicotinamide-nucleotide adenylyltransferase 1; AltName: Full=NAD(+) diphosphorylase 1; AltName: Full=NAD(+) pyrophosphorylase 1; AltName: Full=NMN adenylyltransferase 1 [Sulfolobus acidocaldarius DSM 639]AHC50798.1 nicotinamide-nucleotide adenylyltransferase [Sulfolobus acidocaldarius SUSAZ]AAY79716.1 nicotinamide-nucleotide adenylyltransferase [Sulfolobus acidocaldarius DSM 639]AGE70275.1 nicotinam